VPCMPRRSFAGAERRLPDEGLGRHLPGAAVAHRDGGDIAKLMHSDRLVLGEGLVNSADLFAAVVESFHGSSYVEIRVAIHVSVRTSRGSREQLTADETSAQSVTTDNENLADLVGVPLGDTHFIPLR
jgi:hypothetical protein